MRNLLGRLHARPMPELLRIADAWGISPRAESKGDLVGVLYRTMTQPGAMRDIWERLEPEERAMTLAMADAPDDARAPTVAELATFLNIPEDAARDCALRLYRAGILAREGDDEPLPVGMPPRLILPREIALLARRLQDEMSAGDLARTPLRVLVELLDDAELETAARVWGLSAVPGVAPRPELTRRVLRLVHDRARVDRVIRGLSRDAAAIWRVVRGVEAPLALADAVAQAGFGGLDRGTPARVRAALVELEGALLVWHAYGPDQSRRLFVPDEIRNPPEAQNADTPALVVLERDSAEPRPWRHPDAIAWDLLTLLRVVGDRQAPAWEVADTPPRWLARAVTSRFWIHGSGKPPDGYLELLEALALAEGLLAVVEDVQPARIVIGSRAREWRSQTFREQSRLLRERWLRLPRWIEGEPAGLIEVWGADWRGMRPRLLTALADPELALAVGAWVTLESLALRLAARYPRLLGSSFSAAAARPGSDGGGEREDQDARVTALGDVISVELGGPFAWFGLTETLDIPGQPRAIAVTPFGAALAARKALPEDEDPGVNLAPLLVGANGDVALQAPTPTRVWALSSCAEQVELGRVSQYRLTPASISAALAAGIALDRIVSFLVQSSREHLPRPLADDLAQWASAVRRVRMRRAVVIESDDPAERVRLKSSLETDGWTVEPIGERALVVSLTAPDDAESLGSVSEEARLVQTLRAAGHAPHWLDHSGSETQAASAAGPPDGAVA